MTKRKRNSEPAKLIQESIDERLAQAVVLLSRQYEIIDYLFSQRESEVLKPIESEISSGLPKVQSVYPVYEYVYSLIDNLVRYQKILNVTPKLNQKEQPISDFNLALSPLKEARNNLQHINDNLRCSFSGPLLGSICWNRGPTQYIVALSDVGRSRSVPGIVLDTQTGTFVAELCYVYNETYHDLHKAVSEAAAVHEWLSTKISMSIDNAPYDPNSHFQAIKLEFSLNPK
jgi:hypothetical protein